MKLNDLIALNSRPDAAIADIERAAAEADRLARHAEADLATAERRYADGLVSADDAAVETLDRERQAAARHRDRCRAVAESLDVRLIEATRTQMAAADEAERRAAFDSGQRAFAEARALLADEYPKLAKKIAALLRKVAVHERAIQDANAMLPPGAEPIPLPVLNRGRPARRGETYISRTPIRFNKTTGAELISYSPDDPNVGIRYRESTAQHPDTPAVEHVPLSALVHLPGEEFGVEPYWGRGAKDSGPISHYLQLSQPAPVGRW